MVSRGAISLPVAVQAAKAKASLGQTAGGSAHAGMEFYGAIEGYDGATTSVGRTAPYSRGAQVTLPTGNPHDVSETCLQLKSSKRLVSMTWFSSDRL